MDDMKALNILRALDTWLQSRKNEILESSRKYTSGSADHAFHKGYRAALMDLQVELKDWKGAADGRQNS